MSERHLFIVFYVRMLRQAQHERDYIIMRIIIRLIALLFALQFCTLFPIKMPPCLMPFNKGTGVHYLYNCAYIDDYVQQLGILEFYCTDTDNKAEKINSIKKQLEAIGAELFAAEQQALFAIKTKYQISNEIWQKYINDLHRMKIICAKNMKKSHPDAIHDPNIPADVLEILITLLNQNNINPYSIHLRMVSDEEEINHNPNTVAQAANYIFSFKSSKEFTLSYNYTPSAIELFPQMIEDESIINKTCTCAHEIQHIIQHHHLTCTLLAAYLKRYSGIDCTDLEKTAEYHTLRQIHEAQAEILAAIKDPKIAEYLKTKRETMYYPGHLYEEHFYHLAYINVLWKVRGWLENCSSTTITF